MSDAVPNHAEQLLREHAAVADQCGRCGCPVADWPAHDLWHDQVAELHARLGQLLDVAAPNPGRW